MIHPSWYPTDRQLRQFAVTSLIGFGVVGLVMRLQLDLHVFAAVLWVVGGLTFLLGLSKPRLVLPVYLGLMALTFPIGWLVTNLLLRILFYGVMTSFGLIFWIYGRDSLQLKKPDGESYWRVIKKRTDAESYYRQA